MRTKKQIEEFDGMLLDHEWFVRFVDVTKGLDRKTNKRLQKNRIAFLKWFTKIN